MIFWILLPVGLFACTGFCSDCTVMEEKNGMFCCLLCEQGFYINNCGTDQQALCLPCPTNTYSSGDSDVCTDCTVCEGITLSPCVSFYDTICNCPLNSKCNDVKCITCTDHCPEGYEKEDDECVQCDDGKFNDKAGGWCKSKTTTCPNGQSLRELKSPTKDNICEVAGDYAVSPPLKCPGNVIVAHDKWHSDICDLEEGAVVITTGDLVVNCQKHDTSFTHVLYYKNEPIMTVEYDENKYTVLSTYKHIVYNVQSAQFFISGQLVSYGLYVCKSTHNDKDHYNAVMFGAYTGMIETLRTAAVQFVTSWKLTDYETKTYIDRLGFASCLTESVRNANAEEIMMFSTHVCVISSAAACEDFYIVHGQIATYYANKRQTVRFIN